LNLQKYNDTGNSVVAKWDGCKMIKKKNQVAAADANYAGFLKDIKQRIHQARTIAYRRVNRELMDLYWNIGKDIVQRQNLHGWGKSVVERLSSDLQKEFPGTAGYSAQNLWYMRQFFLEYGDAPILQQLVGEIPWGHNLLIMSKTKDPAAREYYLKSVIEFGWSRNILLNQIKGKAHERHRLAPKQHNFPETLPEHLAEQANDALKDVYVLDFLGIAKPVLENELERRMVEKIRDVMLELGYGFSFIGNQYRVTLKDKEYFIDLLFYHRKLKSLVAVEIKIGSFKPEYAGKMNFYLNLLDVFVREPGENSSIGIILCADRDRVEVEYALRGINTPMGVAEYVLTDKLPPEFLDKLPDAKKIENEIRKELATQQK
jgi:predicted nuclease of restriction endonuclease-like (RecB) superfamily